ncbi:hypothetical protein Tco_0652272 [Tanacetum coccineum]|uniref:Uncharacterized protein n=1 Tax=Tanacetum coccineum TaxID=301880 RepID=A0ABQ4WXE4_9ASTR
MFIDSQFTWDYDSQMTEKYFAEYTLIEVQQFRDSLIQHMKSVKKSIDKRAQLKRQYDRRVNKRPMQMQESKVVSSKAVDASLFVTECRGTKSDEHITRSSSGTYITQAVDADIRPVNDQVPFAEVHLIALHNVLANEQQYIDQSEPSYNTYLLEKGDSNTTPDSTNMSHRGERLTRMLNKIKVNSHAKVQSPKTRNINKPIEPKSHTQKPGRQIAIGQRFSLNKYSVVREKLNTPRSCLMWIPTGRIFKTASLRWIPTRKMFTDSTTKCRYICTIQNRKDSDNGAEKTDNSQNKGLVPNSVPAAPYVPPTNKDLEILFQAMFDEYLEPPRIERQVSPAPAVQVLVSSTGTPSSTTIDQDAPSKSHSLSSSALQSPRLHQGVAAESPLMEDTPFAPIDNDHFINVFAPDPSLKASSSKDLSSTESPYVSQTLHHLRK